MTAAKMVMVVQAERAAVVERAVPVEVDSVCLQLSLQAVRELSPFQGQQVLQVLLVAGCAADLEARCIIPYRLRQVLPVTASAAERTECRVLLAYLLRPEVLVPMVRMVLPVYGATSLPAAAPHLSALLMDFHRIQRQIFHSPATWSVATVC